MSFTPSGDAGSLADALERLLLDPAHAAELGRCGREIVNARFTSDAMARNFEELLQAAMKIVMRAAALFLFLAVLTTGCSSFERAWRNPPAQSAGIAGRWEGRWQSARTGHDGKLRAIITPQTAARYDARFRATYRSVLSAEYGVTLDVKQRGPAI